MDTTHADIREGNRLDITVEFITRRAVDCANGNVHRLLVADSSGQQFAVLTAPDSESSVGLRSGARYRLSALLGADPAGPVESVDAECSICGSPLRPGRVLDAVDPVVGRAASELDLDERFGIIDASASIRPVSEQSVAVDDWTPSPVDDPVEVPDNVCVSCGRQVACERDDRESDHAAGTGLAVRTPPDAGGQQRRDTLSLDEGNARHSVQAKVASGYTPEPAAIDEGELFAGRGFEAGKRLESDSMFVPRCGVAASEHPITGAVERYLTVGMESTLPTMAFQRPRLDLVVVLDVSASMGCPVDEYYYDGGEQQAHTGGETTKLDAATGVLCTITEQLREDDRLGVVLCNHQAHVAKTLRDVDSTDMDAIRRHICEVDPGGDTDLAAGFDAALDVQVADAKDLQSERRVVVVTDMMPNTGTTAASELTDSVADAAANGVHSTFAGVGLDANERLAARLSEIRGANYWSVRSGAAFQRRLREAFDHMVTPVAYDLTVELDADGYELASVHGAEAATDRLAHLGTLFPPAGQDSMAPGGLAVMRLARTWHDPEVELVASWTERGSGEYTASVTVEVPDSPETYTDDGVRTAVALTRYARELREWAVTRHDCPADADGRTTPEMGTTGEHDGHERSPVPLAVSEQRAGRFQRLREYLDAEIARVDGGLQQERALLDVLCRQTRESPVEMG